MTIEIEKVRPRRDWVLVLATPRKTHSANGIILPPSETGAEKVTEGSGELIAVGTGDKNAALELAVGDKIVFRSFLKYANRIPSDDKWGDGTDKFYFLMSSDDILGVLGPGVEVGTFSGPFKLE